MIPGVRHSNGWVSEGMRWTQVSRGKLTGLSKNVKCAAVLQMRVMCVLSMSGLEKKKTRESDWHKGKPGKVKGGIG